jgi:hypothetical protein
MPVLRLVAASLRAATQTMYPDAGCRVPTACGKAFRAKYTQPLVCMASIIDEVLAQVFPEGFGRQI